MERFQSVLRKVDCDKQFRRREEETKVSQTPLQLVALDFKQEAVEENRHCWNDGGGTQRPDESNMNVKTSVGSMGKLQMPASMCESRNILLNDPAAASSLMLEPPHQHPNWV